MTHYISIKNHLHEVKYEIDMLKILIRDSEEREYLTMALSIEQMRYEVGLRLLAS